MLNPELHIVILAAGKGSRMKSKLPKVLHCIGGKPLLGHVVSAASKLKPSQLHVIVGHGKDQVQDYLHSQTLDCELNVIEQVEQKGTGHAVQQAMPFIPEKASVLILTADVPLIQSTTLSALSDSMQSRTLALLTAVMPNPTGLGRILRDNNDDVVGIIEEKDATDTQRAITEINSGIMCARAKELKEWLANIQPNNAQGEFYLTDIVGLAHQQGQVISALTVADKSEVEGINSRVQLAKVERLYQLQCAENFMMNGVTIIDPQRFDIRGDVEIGADTIIDINCVIKGPTKIGSGVTIAANCMISTSNIGDDCSIHANTVIESANLGTQVSVGPFARLRPGTELQERVRIGNFVEIKNTKFAEGAKANHLSYVGDSTVGKNTNIGAGVITCNYDGANKHQTTIGDNVFVGSDSQLVAPVVIEDGATIGAGSTITNKVNCDQLAISRVRQREIDGWQRPVKIKQPNKK